MHVQWWPFDGRHRRWYWFLGLERWEGGWQYGLGLLTLHCSQVGWALWWNRD